MTRRICMNERCRLQNVPSTPLATACPNCGHQLFNISRAFPLTAALIEVADGELLSAPGDEPGDPPTWCIGSHHEPGAGILGGQVGPEASSLPELEAKIVDSDLGMVLQALIDAWEDRANQDTGDDQ